MLTLSTSSDSGSSEAASRPPGSPHERPDRSARTGSEDSCRGRVVLIDGGYPSYRTPRRVLRDRGYRLEVAEDATDRAEKRRAARTADGLFVRWTEVDGRFLDGLECCRALVRYGTGFDNVDLTAATERRVAVSNVSSYARHSVSDHTLALLTACLRRIGPGRRWTEESFLAPPEYGIPELRTLTVGIVGLGDIGGTFSRKIEPLVEEVLAYDPYVDAPTCADAGARKVGFDTLLDRVDVLSVHCALTEETRMLLDAGALSRLPSGSILLNTARGDVVDEAAVLEALREGRLGSVGIDVFGEEPPSERYRRLIERDDVVATPHYAWYSRQSLRTLHRKAAGNMADLLDGEAPPDCLNPEVVDGG